MAYLDKDPTDPEVPRLERDWLANRRKDELIDIIIEMKKKLPGNTTKLDTGPTLAALQNVAVRLKGTSPIAEYVRIPKHELNWRSGLESAPWRIRLSSSDPGHPPLYLELRGDVFVGRSATGLDPDLDLSAFSAEKLGVSRQHAILRPLKDDLLLIDLGSTNGTAVNGKKLTSSRHVKLEDRDTVSFGLLHFELRIMGRPWGVVAKALATSPLKEEKKKRR